MSKLYNKLLFIVVCLLLSSHILTFASTLRNDEIVVVNALDNHSLKSAFPLMWKILTPKYLRFTNETCYKFLRPKRKPRPVFTIYTEFVTKICNFSTSIKPCGN